MDFGLSEEQTLLQDSINGFLDGASSLDQVREYVQDPEQDVWSGLTELGVRAAVSLEDAHAVMDVLAVRDPRVATNWSRRFKNHQEKLRTGDAYAVAEVVRNLALRLAGTKLGPAESTMYRQARHALVAELAVSFGISDEAASDRVDRALERSA